MIPFILVLTFSVLLTLVVVIPAIFLFFRWFAMFLTGDTVDTDTGDIKIPTFYAIRSDNIGDDIARVFCMSLVGSVFGGIHCVGWFFDFPSSAEAMLWRVSSAVLTGIAFLFPMLSILALPLFGNSIARIYQAQYFFAAVFTIFLLVYVVSRLILMVEAFISLRHLTPGMLAIVKWTSFIPHI